MVFSGENEWKTVMKDIDEHKANIMNQRTKIAFVLLLAAISLACVSCIVVWHFNATYNGGIMKEYQYTNGKNQFKMLFSGSERKGHPGQLKYIDLYTNGLFMMKEEYGKVLEGDSVFVVDPKAAAIYLDDKLMGEGNQAVNSGMGYISLERINEQRMRISINPMDPSMKKKVIRIIPSDFIMNNGKRVVNDTIRLYLYLEKPSRRIE